MTFTIKIFTANPNIDSIQTRIPLLNTLVSKAGILKEYGEIKDKSGQYLQASLKTYRLAADLIDYLRNEYKSEGSKQFLMSEAKAFYELSIEVAAILYEEDKNPAYLEVIFQSIEESKSALLLDQLQKAEARSFAGVPDSLLELERQLEYDIAGYEKHIYDEKNRRGQGKYR